MSKVLVDVEAWKNNFLFYKSIGTEVHVYHREQTKNIWGSTRQSMGGETMTQIKAGAAPAV